MWREHFMSGVSLHGRNIQSSKTGGRRIKGIVKNIFCHEWSSTDAKDIKCRNKQMGTHNREGHGEKWNGAEKSKAC